MKKLLTFTFALVVCVLSFTTRAQAGYENIRFTDGSFDFYAQNTDGVMLFYKYIYDEEATEPTIKGVMVVVPTGWKTDNNGNIIETWSHEFPYTADVIRVPQTALEITVIGIDAFAFRMEHNLVTVELPNTLQFIGSEAFEEDALLKTINLPASLESVGVAAFQNSGLEEVTIPASAAGWEMSVFQHCEQLTTIHFDEQLTAIPERMFFNTAVENVTFPSGLKQIGLGAFSGCTELKHIVLPEGLDTIEMGAFIDAPLTELTIPASVRSIGSFAFTDVSHLSSITSLITEPAGVLEENAIGNSWGGEEEEQAPTLPLLRVPKGTISLYQADSEWSKFPIEEIVTSNIETIGDPTTTNHKVLQNGQILIFRDGKTYTAIGTKVK